MPSTLTVPALLEPHLADRADEVAVIEGERTITWSEFDALCRKTAAWLTTQGIGRGDRVAVWLPNRVEWLALFFGLARVGAALVAVNTRYRAAELEYILDRSGARLLVLQPDFRKIDFRAALREVRPQTLRRLERVAVVGTASGAPSPVLGKPTVAFDAFATTQSGAASRADPEAEAAVFTTSGTTKAPKLVVHAQRTLAFHSGRVALAHGFQRGGARLLAALPFCGVFGLNATLGAIAGGAPLVVMDAFDGPAAAELIRRHAVTHVYGSDEMLRRIVAAVPDPDPFPTARVFGFAAFNPGAVEFALAASRRGIPILGMYGSSEAQALFACQPASLALERRIEAGGRPAAGQDAEVRVRDVESGELLAPGASGELEIRAPSNFVGYLDDPEATRETIRPDGFFRTGDIGHLRDDGTFVYEARRGDAIRIAGYLVSPPEIEDGLKRLPLVADAQVVGVEVSGQMRVVAFVIPAPGTEPREADVIAAAGGIMAGFKVPARVWFVDAYPTTEGANGVKIQRAELRRMALERLSAS